MRLQERNKVLAAIFATAIIVALLWIYLVALRPWNRGEYREAAGASYLL